MPNEEVKFELPQIALDQMQKHLDTPPPQIEGVIVNVDKDDRDRVIVNVSVADEIVDMVTSGPKRYDTPEMHDEYYRRRVAEHQDDMGSLRELIDCSKKVVNAMETKRAREEMKTAAGEILYKSYERQIETATRHFVNVTGQTALEAAQKIAELQQHHPEGFIEPVDASLGFSDVEPREEMYIPKLESIMHVQNPIVDEKIPDSIYFTIPDKEIVDSYEMQKHVVVAGDGPIEGLDEMKDLVTSRPVTFISLPPESVVCRTERYVRIDSLPIEVRDVVKRCIYMYSGMLCDEQSSMQYLRDAVKDLYDNVEKLIDKKKQEEQWSTKEGDI